MTADARRIAGLYRDLGYNPLPSRADIKRPSLLAFSKLRDSGVGQSILGKWWTPNVQLCTGVRWNLLVVDLDGPIGVEVWRCLTARHPTPPTWAVQHDPACGMHLWFSVPAGVEAVPFKSTLWQAPGVRHCAIELLGDRNLIVAPPSIHPRSGRPYGFLAGQGPASVPFPAPLPGWVLDAIKPPAPVVLPFRPAPRRGYGFACRYDRDQVEAIIPPADRIALAASWGLRLATVKPNDAGWMACHALGRPDRTPSASFSPVTGRYWEPAIKPISIFDLGAALGAYRDWTQAVNDLGDRYQVPRREDLHAR